MLYLPEKTGENEQISNMVEKSGGEPRSRRTVPALVRASPQDGRAGQTAKDGNHTKTNGNTFQQPKRCFGAAEREPLDGRSPKSKHRLDAAERRYTGRTGRVPRQGWLPTDG